MSAHLTLPGSIPGLLRFATPLVDLADPLRRGVAVGTYAEGRYADHVFACWISGDSERVPLARVALDLTDATGRAHTAWWVAERGGSLRPVDACNALWVHEAGERMWSLWSLWAPLADACDVYGPYEDDKRLRVAALAHLDPDDPRTLPDGSRWVDAEALRLVVLHLAGVRDG